MALTASQKKDGVRRGDPLTPQQLRILRCCARGDTQVGAAVRLGLNRHTIDWEIRRINGKLGAVNSTNAVYIGFKQGLIG
jgi:DNA-binding CsgD family transcriptional regulator